MAAVHGQTEEMITNLGVVRTRSTAANKGQNTTAASTVATYTDRNSMETYLLAHGYTQAQLNSMNINDLVYATKLKQDAGIV